MGNPLLHVAGGRWILAAMLTLVLAASLRAQSTQPVWWPPQSLYGRPVAQPYFDFPNWARYSYCRPAPLAWGYDPFPDYGAGECDWYGAHSVSCPGDFVAHRPNAWYASADFAPLLIDYLDGFPVARIGPSGPVVLSTNDLEPEFDAGGKFTLGRRIFDCYRLEATYLGQYNWDDAVLVVNANDNLSTFLSGFSDPPTTGLDEAGSVGIAMQSSFQSAEINLRYWADMPPGPFDVSYLVGARYLRIRDQFALASDANAGVTLNELEANTVNDLWGIQIGIEGAFLVSTRWWIDVDLKAGVFNNDASQETISLVNGAGDLITAGRDCTAWMGDISVVANWQMTPWLAFRIGYQAIFLTGVALAHEQVVQAPLFSNVPGALNDSGEVAYHGPIIGLMGVW